MIVCIYCKQVKPPSREHALPRALGGDLVIPDVCQDCNGRLSIVDQALAEGSFVSLQRVVGTPLDAFGVKLGGDHFFEDVQSGLILEAAVRNGLQPEVYSQVHAIFHEDGSASLRVICRGQEKFENLVAHLASRIERTELSSIHTKIGPSEAGATPRFVMHRDTDGFFRGQDEKDVDRLRRTLREKWSEAVDNYRARVKSGPPIPSRRPEQIELQVGIRIDWNLVLRAIAKIAFNVMTARMGSDVALRSDFDPIRAYILGTDVRIPDAVPGEISVDGRFVFSSPTGEPLVPCDEHAVVLFGTAQGFFAGVTLYKTSNFLVCLSDVASPHVIPQVHVFSATREGNAELDLEEIVRRLRQRSHS